MKPKPPTQIIINQDHRPWQTPDAPWLMTQSWCDLLFAHWSFLPEVIQPLIPRELTLDTFDGKAWVGVVPFKMKYVRPHYLPPIPFTTTFPELNVRTYVIAPDGKPGVWFFSLDADHRLAVETARNTFHLPYFNAQMQIEVHDDCVRYQSRRVDRRTGSGEFVGNYWPISDVYYSEPGTLDYWLTERYALYAKSNHLYRGEVQHAPWPLQRAEAEILINTVTDAHGVFLPDEKPMLHYVKQLDVIGWYLGRL